MKSLKSGERVSAMLLELENDDGYRELSLKAAQITTAWQDIKDKKESGEVITTRIININKGGLIVELSGIQGFLPLSQLSAEHYPKVEGGDTTKIVQALQKYRNQDFQVKILDFSEEEKRLIVSEKAIMEAKMQAEVAKYTIRDILARDQKVSAKIIAIEGGKISLSLKALKPDPWQSAQEKYSVGQKIDGKIAKITNYGALISCDDDITGLIPLAEFKEKKPTETLKIGDSISVEISSLDPQEHKMILKLNEISS